MNATRPAYLRTYREGTLREVSLKLKEALSHCTLCPRDCGVDRHQLEAGICRTGDRARIASYAPHFGEEPPLVGLNGSGTLFFSRCNLLCNFCQNYDISHQGMGITVDDSELAGMMLWLQMRGCHNINFVTPSHVVPQIISALEIAVEQGLRIPLVYNTSGYDKVETLKMLEGIIDIYMPDIKFLDAATAKNTCRTEDYPDTVRRAIREMYRQVGNLRLDERGIATRGLLIRHLVMPGSLEDTREILRFIARDISPEAFVNIMPQYRPCGTVAETPRFNRHLSQGEYDRAMKMAREEGLVNLL